MNGREGATPGEITLEEDIKESLPDPSYSPSTRPRRAEEDSRLIDHATQTWTCGI